MEISILNPHPETRTPRRPRIATRLTRIFALALSLFAIGAQAIDPARGFQVHPTTGAIQAPVDAATFRSANGIFGTASKADVLETPLFAADAGSTDAYAATLSPAITSYVTGALYWFKANTANTGAATLNLNALGAKTIKKAAGGITTDLATDDIRAGQWVMVVYDGTNMQMQSTLGNASLLSANNLSDLADFAAARSNLGLAASATTDTTNASNIASGTLSNARLASTVLAAATNTTFASGTTTTWSSTADWANLDMGDHMRLRLGALSALEINGSALLQQAGVSIPANSILAIGTAGHLTPITSSANIQSFLGSADYSAARTNLGLAIGANVQAYDPDLTTYAGITPTTVVQNLLALTNPSAISFIKIAADNSVSTRTPAQVRSDLTVKQKSYAKVTGSDWTSASATFSDVTGLAWSIAANENWHADLHLSVIGGTSGSGIKFKFTGPASPTSVLIEIHGATSGTTSFGQEIQTAFSATPATTFVGGTSVVGYIRIHIVVNNGANAGTVQLQANNSSPSGTTTIKVNSDIDAEEQ